LRTSAAVVPVACTALLDSDVEVRRQAVGALRRVSSAVSKMVLPPSELLPPHDRKLTMLENERVVIEQARVRAFMQGIKPILDGFRDNTSSLTRAAGDSDKTVRIEVRRVLEDLGQVAQKVLRLRDVFDYPQVKPPEKLPDREPEKSGGPSTSAARGRVQVASAQLDLVPPTPGRSVEACSPIPAQPLAPDCPEEPALGTPEKLTPADSTALPIGAVPAHPASFLQRGRDELPPPKPLGPIGAAETTLDRTMTALLAGLSDPVPRVRLATIDVLETMGKLAAPAAPALVRSLSDTHRFVRWAAARTLGRMAPEDAREAVPALARLINPWEDLSVRTAAITTLGQYGPAAKSAVPVLASAINKSDVDLRVAAINALEAIGTGAAPALPAIGRALQDSSPQVRVTAARALGRFGPLAIDQLPALNQVLNDPAEEVRRAASEAILSIDRR
jgi:HEAT repeat protein